MTKRPQSWWENRYPNGMNGKNHPRWKGGTHIDPSTGYKRIWISSGKGHGKYIGEHRYVMSQFLGRILERNEHIHHIDGNKLNNDISNLIIMSHSAHSKLHIDIGLTGFKPGNQMAKRRNKIN